MLIARFNVITLEAELKPEVAASVCAIVYAGYLMGTEVDELKHLHILFTLKYGKPFTQDVIDNKEKYINHRLLKILTMTECPDVTVVDAYLEAIAQSYGVEYVPQVTAVQPISSTLGIALPTPGQPMPGSAVPEPMPDLSGGEAPSAAEPALMMGTEVVLPTAQPIATPAVASGGGSNFSAGEVVGMTPPPSGAGSASGAVPFRVQLSKVCAAHRSSTASGHLISGFGLTVDAQDVVVGIDAADTAGVDADGLGAIRLGDKVVAINGRQVTGDSPVKSLSADVDLGTCVHVDLVRFVAGVSDNVASVATPAAVPAAVPVVGSAATTVIEQPKVVGESVPPAPQSPAVTVGPPPTAVPPVPPSAGPTTEESMEDILKKRLDALKMA